MRSIILSNAHPRAKPNAFNKYGMITDISTHTLIRNKESVAGVVSSGVAVVRDEDGSA